MAVTDLLTSKQAEVLHAYQTKPFKIMILTGAVRSGKTFIDNFLFLYELKRTAKLAALRNDKHPRYILAGATSNSISVLHDTPRNTAIPLISTFDEIVIFFALQNSNAHGFI